MLSVGLVPTTVAGTNACRRHGQARVQGGSRPITINLASSNAAVRKSSRREHRGASRAAIGAFRRRHQQGLTRATAAISGAANGIKKSKTLTVTPASFVSPTSLTFGTVPVGDKRSTRRDAHQQGQDVVHGWEHCHYRHSPSVICEDGELPADIGCRRVMQH